jgi:hypothetical protein
LFKTVLYTRVIIDQAKKGKCVDIATLGGLQPTHQPPSLADPHSSFFKQLVQVMIEQLNQLISD